MRKSLSFVVLSLFSLLFVASSHAATIFDLGSSWKYFVGTQEASTPQNAWRAINFDDSSWQTGAAPIGYGEPDIRSTVPTATLTVYHRKAFVVTNLSQITRLDIIIRIDDGFVAWINGTEIGRYNVPAGDLAFNALAPSAFEPDSRVVTVTNPAAILVPGTNVIAIHALNQAASSSDIYMDASLATVSGETVAPTITSFSPTGGATLTNLTQVSVTFSEPVNGVNAGDLMVNGQPASSLTIGANNTYVFSFIQPAYGSVQISWATAHAIEDLAFPPNPFNATAPGATWQYTLQDRAAPTVAGTSPTPGFTVRSLTQVEITFSEPVRGVDAADLRINGTAAAAVSSTDPSRYTFTFPQPAVGTVQVAWNGSHGISDLATPANNFVTPSGWSYVLNPNAALPDVIITEFLAAQAESRPPATELRDEEGDAEDWIEIFNSGEIAVDLRGWSLTDSANNLKKWTFPQTNLAAKGYMVIFASEKDRNTPGRQLHTNFKLGNNGEYLALVKPDGTIASQYAPSFPAQIADVSFGFPTLTTASNAITASSLASAFVPVDNSLALDWTSQIFNDGTWIKGTNGVGYETAGSPVPSLRSFIKTDVQSQMLGKNPGIFVRIPFVVTDAAKLSLLNLRLRYDDGVVGYVNGREVLRVNAPSNEFNTPLFFNDRATAQRANNSTNLEDFDLSFVVRQGGIQTGTNILAFHVLNFAPDDSDALVNAELIGTTRDIQLMQTRYFPTPTPGADNGPGTAALGPVIFDEDHTPKVPQDNEDIFVTTRVSPTFSPVSQVTVTYRVMFGTEVTIPMLDDGQHSDGAANDGVFGATLPTAALSTPGQMVRWFFRATDTQARSTRLPAFADALNSVQYFGTIVFLPQTNNLPIFHWFMPNPEAAGTDAGQRGSIFYLGEFYDNVNANVHGQSSRGFPKHSYDIDFNGNVFKYAEDAPLRVDDINLLTTYPDKAKMRNMLSHATYRDAGGEYHYVVPIRIHTNGGFFGDWHIVENGDANYLKRLGKDPNGALYKMYNTFTDVSDYTISTAEAEKKTRKTENNADIKALFEGVVSGPVATRTNYIFDNLNIPQMVNFLAAKVITADGDCCHKNYYFYRDSDGTGEWEAYPWDVDLSWGRQWNSTDTYWNHNLVGVNNGINQGGNNGVMTQVLSGNPQTQQMYLRRIRTIMDEQLGNTNSLNTNFEAQIAYWLKLIEPDAAVDAQKWPFSITWGNAAGAGTVTSTCCTQTIAQAAAELTTNYLPARRRFMYNNLTTVPAAQPTNAAVDIRSIEHSPGNGNQAQEYIELVNTNTYAVDISGWKLAGAIKHTFRGGTVIPINGRLYVSPNVNAFRARASGPRGGLGLFVQGNYDGQLSARGESVYLSNKVGRAVSSLTYTGTPSLAQQYLRITEIMYHAAPATAPFLLDDFDYIELKNIGSVAVPLAGVHFTNGIEFTFTASSAVTSLNPGQRVVLVKNAAAFVSRYGSSATIAGVYNGSLDNAGDLIKLDDALNDKILEFDYNNSWYPITDGLGLSLVIVNENAAFDMWDLKESWRPSADGGSPGAGDSPAVTSAPIIVNEVLTHTDLPAVDRIELFNPTASAVNIGGWYISDDFSTPKKFRIPTNTMIAAGGYVTFSEANFNTPSNAPTSFSFGSTGDEAYIFSADAAGNLTAYYHGFNFGAAENGTSFGRYITSVGLTQFVGQASQTFGASNSLPKVGPVVISEIMYHPPDVGGVDNSVDEYIELQNITTTNVALYNQTNGWELRDAVDFVFKTNHSIPAGGYLVVANFNPTNTAQLAAFRARYSLGTNVTIVGPYSGKLDNSDDSIELFRPDTADAEGVPYILVERVHYYTTNDWDVLADGVGPSLHRKDVRAFGNDPINWTAAAPTTGGALVPSGAPVITQQPRNITVAEGTSTNLSVVATGTGLAYQWRFNGQSVSNGNAAVLPLPNLRLDQSGNYSVAVFNGGGAVFSSNGFVNVRPLPVITQQPQNVRTNQGSNATFTVAATTTGPARYQWRFNGTNIFGATNSSLTLTNVKLEVDPGFYDVRVTDDYGSVLSQTNVFIVLVRPVITNSPPTSLIAVQGQDMTFSIVAGPDYPMLPLSIRWLRQGATYITNGPQTVVYTNLQANPTIVRVQVTNLAASVASPNINVTVLPDTDGDGAPDDWEIATGFNPTNSADGVLDTDGDGMRNRDEFQAGTDPRDSNSVLRASISGSAGVVVQFMAQSSNYYVVQYRANSVSGQWQTLSNIIPQGAIRPVQIFDPAGTTGQRFYRIGAQLVP